MGKVLLLSRFVVGERIESKALTFLLFIHFVPPLGAVNEALGCVDLWWATLDDGENKSDEDRLEEENDRTVAEEWFRVIL